MISLLPLHLPFDVRTPILVESIDSVTTLSALQLVSKDFKSVVDDSRFLQSLLVKFKGPSFLAGVFSESPKKFLYLDHDITCVFQSIVGNKSHEDDRASRFLVKTSTVALKNLSLNLFTMHAGKRVTYYKFSDAQIEKLKKVDFAQKNDWKECIETMAIQMTKHHFYNPIHLAFPEEKVSCLQKIQSAFLKPNEEMQALIDSYEIVDAFFINPSELLIYAGKEQELNCHQIYRAALDEGYLLTFAGFLKDFLSSISIVIKDGRFAFACNNQQKLIFLNVLNNCTQEEINCFMPFFNSDVERFLLGKIFPTIWPNVQDELGREKCLKALNLFVINKFIEKFKTNKDENKILHVDYDHALRNYMLHLLKIPQRRFKASMQENIVVPWMLNVCKIIFPGVWPE